MTARAQSADHEIRLRWWAVALPVAVFVALLALLTSGGPNETATGLEPVTRILEHVHSALL
ncbi:hypothetical protein [Streptomyces profundus]|uniref:hypothetical protein n=1 Tax=Streptomyces profundus TaxID=2867410 RepID=UPI001D169E5C|nr:hypothetical protein [Streptomyces sp. MA3_2.13]UED83467.1 hypothetical protein K4G22_03990 [Streptomyces sp. MA3_2.13]